MNNRTIIYSCILLAGVFISAISQVMLKKSAMKSYDSKLKEYLNPMVISAYLMFVGTTFLSIVAYKGIPLVTTTAGALARNYQIDKPYFFNRKEVKDHGEGGNTVGYHPKDGDRVIIIEDVITAGTAIRETMPILKGCADVKVTDMFISVNRCEVGKTPGKTAVMEVAEEFGIQVHALITVKDIYEYLKEQGTYDSVLKAMETYMEQYCIFE